MDSIQLNKALGRCVIFSGIEDPAGLVGGVSEIVSFRRGEAISTVSDGEPRAGVILSGDASVVKSSGDGRPLPMTTLTPGRLFGIAGMFGGDGGELSEITAAHDAEVLFISERSLRRLLGENPALAINYIAYLTQRVRFLNRKIDSFTAGNAELKLLMFLTGLAEADGSVALPFSAGECARRLDMGRASFYRALDSLERRGAIIREGGARGLRIPK